MAGAIIRRGSLQGADLTVAEMYGSDLGSARLEAAALAWAGLEGAILNGANLRGAGDVDWSPQTSFAERVRDSTGKASNPATVCRPGGLRVSALNKSLEHWNLLRSAKPCLSGSSRMLMSRIVAGCRTDMVRSSVPSPTRRRRAGSLITSQPVTKAWTGAPPHPDRDLSPGAPKWAVKPGVEFIWERSVGDVRDGTRIAAKNARILSVAVRCSRWIPHPGESIFGGRDRGIAFGSGDDGHPVVGDSPYMERCHQPRNAVTVELDGMNGRRS